MTLRRNPFYTIGCNFFLDRDFNIRVLSGERMFVICVCVLYKHVVNTPDNEWTCHSSDAFWELVKDKVLVCKVIGLILQKTP